MSLILKTGNTYRRCFEPGDISSCPLQFRDFVGLYKYLGIENKLHLHCFEGTHWNRGKERISLTDQEVELACFELI